jgi:hypothetical protein
MKGSLCLSMSIDSMFLVHSYSCRIFCTNILIKHLEMQLVVILSRLGIINNLQVRTMSLMKGNRLAESVSFAEHLQELLYSPVVHNYLFLARMCTVDYI